MAVTTIVNTMNLDSGLVLTPERYHPGRKLSLKSSVPGTYLGDLVDLVSQTISPKSFEKYSNKVYLIDTGDVTEGRIRGDKVVLTSINSQKKIITPGQVIISRLRPYLRQVGYVDSFLGEKFGDNTIIACSTEFYTLTSRNSESIAFLVPYLLSDAIQEIFSKAVEGGQHPRFNEDVLLSLLIPNDILEMRPYLSSQVLSAISKYREYEKTISNSIDTINIRLERLIT